MADSVQVSHPPRFTRPIVTQFPASRPLPVSSRSPVPQSSTSTSTLSWISRLQSVTSTCPAGMGYEYSGCYGLFVVTVFLFLQFLVILTERSCGENSAHVIVLASGRLLNLGCALGVPFEMSCSFTVQVPAQLDY